MSALPDLLVQNLFSIVSSVIAAVAGYLVLRAIRHMRGDSAETVERATNAEASAGNAAADASRAATEIDTLTAIVRKQAAAIDTMAHRYDDVLSKFLNAEVLDMRLKRVERYLAEHELDKRQQEALTTQEGILRAFSGPIPTTESSNA